MQFIAHFEKIPVIDDYDIIVAGGGVSGIAAALSGARMGYRVLLLEKQCSLGGLATTGLVNYWVPLCNGRGKMIIRGIAEELLHLSVQYGFDTFPEAWKHGIPEEETTQRCVSRFSTGLFSLALLKLLRDTGVTILYDALVSKPQMDGNHCEGLIIDGKSGRRLYRAKVIVDATGDAHILKLAGVPTIDGENYLTYCADGITLEGCRQAIEHQDVARAYYHPHGGAANLHGKGHPKDLPLFRGSDMETLNHYLQLNQLMLLENEKDKARTERNIHMLPGMAQFRTTRRLDGNATLSAEDCYRHQQSSIGTICDFEYRDRLYEVPYGTLVHDAYDNLITCGRSASGTGWGWDVLRVIPPAILTGQAAGTAAALALKHNTSVPQVPITPLQKTLSDTGVMIHFEDSLIPKDSTKDNHAALAEHI